MKKEKALDIVNDYLARWVNVFGEAMPESEIRDIWAAFGIVENEVLFSIGVNGDEDEDEDEDEEPYCA